jgi:hypothetical protein
MFFKWPFSLSVLSVSLYECSPPFYHLNNVRWMRIIDLLIVQYSHFFVTSCFYAQSSARSFVRKGPESVVFFWFLAKKQLKVNTKVDSRESVWKCPTELSQDRPKCRASVIHLGFLRTGKTLRCAAVWGIHLTVLAVLCTVGSNGDCNRKQKHMRVTDMNSTWTQCLYSVRVQDQRPPPNYFCHDRFLYK